MRKIIATVVAALAAATMMTAVSAPASAATVTVQSGMKYGNVPPVPTGNAHGIEDFCTLGAVGYDAAGRKLAVTAGHCSNGEVDGWKAVTVGGTEIGTYVTSRKDFVVGVLEYNKYDYGFILLNDNVVLADDPTTRVNPKSVGKPGSWQGFCKYGHSFLHPGERCGFSIGLRPIEFDANMSQFTGDSGGPVYWDKDPTVIHGIVSRPSVGGLNIIQRLDSAIADAASKGWIGAGFYPVA